MGWLADCYAEAFLMTCLSGPSTTTEGQQKLSDLSGLEQ